MQPIPIGDFDMIIYGDGADRTSMQKITTAQLMNAGARLFHSGKVSDDATHEEFPYSL
jgi:hypothetical protein